MSDTALFGADAVNGRSRWNILDHTGPSSYVTGGESWPQQSSLGGTNSAGLSGIQAVIACGLSLSGNYRVEAVYGGKGVRPSINLVWSFSGLNGEGVIVTQNAAGSGMTPGTVVPIQFAGGVGSGAAGTVKVLTATTIAITITNPGSYTVAPTASVSGTGGTAPTLTVTLSSPGQQVTAGANLSGETVRLLAIGG